MAARTEINGLIWAFGLAFLSACSDARRQEAALALDEARLAVAGARDVGADSSATLGFRDAQAALVDAETLYADKNYAGAKALALKADEEALTSTAPARTMRAGQAAN